MTAPLGGPFIGAPYTAKTAARPTPKASRPPELDDRDWLKKRYAQVGDRTIAKELGCHRRTVARAREHHDIDSHGVGTRRVGDRILPVESHNKSLKLLGTYFDDDQRHHRPPTAETLIAAIKSWLDARKHRDQPAIEDALLSVASAALLAHQHEVRLRKAA